MKKNFFKFLLLGAFTLSLGAGFVGCKDYDDDINALQSQIDAVKSDLSKLDYSKAVKNVVLNGTKLVVTYYDNTTSEVELSSIIPDVPTYDIKLEGNTLYVNGEAKGTVDLSSATVPSSAYTVVDGYLAINGTKTSVKIPAEYTPEPDAVLSIKLEDGKYYLYSDDTKVTGFIPEVKVEDGVLYIAGVAQELDLGFPTDNIQFIYDSKDRLQAAYIQIGEDKFYMPIYSALDGLLFMPSYYVDGIPALHFTRIAITPTANNYGGRVMESETEAIFRTNPANADVTAVKSWKYYNRAVEVYGGYAADTRATDLEEDDLLSIVGGYDGVTPVGGAVKMLVTADFRKSQADGSEKDFVVLEAEVGADGYQNTVTSDEVQVWLNTVYNVAILDTVAWKAQDQNVYPSTEALGKAATPQHMIGSETEFGSGLPNSFNLNNYVLAASDMYDNYSNGDAVGYGEVDGAYFMNLPDLEIYHYKYRFSEVSYVPGVPSGDNTDQAAFVVLDPATGIVTIDKDQVYASIGRTPVFKAELLNAAGVVMATHYIKFQIVRSAVKPIPDVTIELGNIPYVDLYKNNAPYRAVGLPWARANKEIYELLKLELADFVAQYTTQTLVVDHTSTTNNNVNGTKPDLGSLNTTNFLPRPDTSTSALAIIIDPQTRFGAHTWTANLIPVRPDLYPTVKVIFKFNITKPEHPVFDPAYVKDGVATTKGRIIDAQTDYYAMNAVMYESFLLSSRTDFDTNVVEAIEDAPNGTYGGKKEQTHTMAFSFSSNYAAGTPRYTAAPAEQVAVNGTISTRTPQTDYTEQIIGMSTPIDIAQRTYDVVFRSVYYNGGVVETKWKYRFINPLEVTLVPFVMPTEINPTVEPLAPHVSVSVAGQAIYVAGVAQSGIGVYNVPAIREMDWSLDLETEEADQLYFQTTRVQTGGGGRGQQPTYAYYPTDLVWDNEGTSLDSDKTSETITLTVTTPYATYSIVDQPITLQKTVDMPTAE